MAKRGSWTTRFGFYLAAIGSACGLGNLWRFPYVVGNNGGGAFVLLYLLFAVLIGLPLLIGELMLGKWSHRSVLGASQALDQAKWRPYVWIARLSVILSLVVLSYYAVISGWVLHYSTRFLMGLLTSDVSFADRGKLELLLSNGWLQLSLASVHLIVACVVVLKGVQEGLERWIGAMMPIFSILLVLLAIKSLSLPTSIDAVRFLFYPDFSKLQLASPLHAIGHVLFTLSVGFGTMVTFGSYMRDNDHIPTAGFRVTIVDTLLSLFAGLLVFPIVLQGSSDIQLTDPGLLFQALPQFLISMSGGPLFGLAFFVCLYLAALGASIGLLEVIVSNFVDQLKIKRATATWIAGVIALMLAILPALSNKLSSHIGGKSILEILDFALINLCLPLIAMGVAFAISRGLRKSEKERLFIDQNKIESVALFPHWIAMMNWVIPFLIGIAFLFQILEWLHLAQ